MVSQPTEFIFFECTRKECRFRFPFASLEEQGLLPPETVNCPQCGANTVIAARSQPQAAEQTRERAEAQGHRISVLVDNLRSTFNVGAVFRTADGCGFEHIHLCGITPTPDNQRVGKTALGAEHAVPWTRYCSSLQAADRLRQEGWQLWCLENTPEADTVYPGPLEHTGEPIALVIGNEIAGVDPDLIKMCDRIITIPMLGYKRSLNAAIAFGVAAYHLRYGLQLPE
jgi:tRNA G18 (ribose-2'-O)-methylase SpoU